MRDVNTTFDNYGICQATLRNPKFIKTDNLYRLAYFKMFKTIIFLTYWKLISPKGGLQTKTHTLQWVSNYGSCFFQQIHPGIHLFQQSSRLDTTEPAYPDQYTKPCTGKADCLLQKQPDDERESWRKMAIPEVDLYPSRQNITKSFKPFVLQVKLILLKKDKTFLKLYYHSQRTRIQNSIIQYDDSIRYYDSIFLPLPMLLVIRFLWSTGNFQQETEELLWITVFCQSPTSKNSCPLPENLHNKIM